MRCCFLVTVFLLSWIANVKSVYHVLSKKEFKISKKDVLFGYSITYQQNLKRLIISAPKEDSIGRIYKCDITSESCTGIRISIITNGPTNPWLGAKVSSGRDFSMACAPRYIETSKKKKGTFGRCYVVTHNNTFEMAVLPDSAKEPGLIPYENYMDSFGWSADIDRQGNIIVGGPAMYTGRAMLYTNKNATPKLLQFPTGKIKFNFGYSVTSGSFYSTSTTTFAISSPYGTDGYGMVILTDGKEAWPLGGPKQYAPPVGSLFGASMCSAKLRGPGQREALVIGAPTYATIGKVDVGAVYVYQYDVALKVVTHQRTILGKINGARFGSAIISLGDLNGDLKDDIAVSAPYEDSGRGAVYIYSGAEILRNELPSMLRELQRIQPEGYMGLGHSLAAIQDYDDNGCNELAIGAPDSDKVMYLACMAKIIVRVQPLVEDRTAPYKRARRNDTYFVFQSCVDIQYPTKPKTIKADILVKVSLTHPTARLLGAGADESLTYTILTLKEKKIKYCNEVGIIVPLESGHEPVIQYTVTATQTDSPINNSYFDPIHVMLSDLSVLTRTETVWVADCSGKHECMPVINFTISSTMVNNYTIGSTSKEHVSVMLHNTGDVAYTTCVRVSVSGVRVQKWPSMCKMGDDDVIFCAPKVPIGKNADWSTGEIELETSGLKSDVKNISFSVDVFPHCQDTTKSQHKEMMINLFANPNGLTLKGSTLSGDVVSLTREELEETGKQISHVYTVFNGAVTDWVNLKSVVIVNKEQFFKSVIVNVDSEAPNDCQNQVSNDDKHVTICTITELKSSHKFDLTVTVYTEPGALMAEDFKEHNETVESELRLTFEENERHQNVTSILMHTQVSVPLWVIIVASLVGLLITIIFIFALYELGFFRRKNQENLRKLKREVHRQSVRRSNIRPPSGDKAPVDEKEKLVLDQIKPKDLRDDLVTAKFNIRKSQIILGLQKNLRLDTPPVNVAEPSTSKVSAGHID